MIAPLTQQCLHKLISRLYQITTMPPEFYSHGDLIFLDCHCEGEEFGAAKQTKSPYPWQSLLPADMRLPHVRRILLRKIFSRSQ